MRCRPTLTTRRSDRRQRRGDHGGIQHGGTVSATRCRHRARPHRPHNGRHQETAERDAGRDHRRPSADLRQPAARETRPPARETHPPVRETNPRQGKTPTRTLHRLDLRLHRTWPRHRVVHRPRLLPPEVLRPHRRGRTSHGLLRCSRPERHQLIPRAEPVSWEVDDVGRLVDFLFPCWGIRSVVFHRFAEIFWRAARSCDLLSGYYTP
jgi:hypothetical protein